MKGKVEAILKKPVNKMRTMYAAATVAGMSAAMPIVCANDATATVVEKIIDIVLKIFRYIGVLLAVWAVGQLVLAFKNEDADSKSRAMMMLVVGAALIGIKALVDGLQLTSYLT